jgi:translation initiation factor 4E
MTETETSELVENAQQLTVSSPQDGIDQNHHGADQSANGENDVDAQPASNGTNLNILHPLENEWTFWYDRRPAQGKRMKGELENYESNLREIGTFGTVEDFWRYYNHMMKPSKMENNANYHLFKKGVKPMWEDEANAKGGKWVLMMKDKNILDSAWENVVLALIGETLDVDNEVCGAVVSRRKAGDRIAVWNRDRDNEPGILSLGRKLKALIGVDASKIQSSYQSHEDSMRTGASYSNPAKYKL